MFSVMMSFAEIGLYGSLMIVAVLIVRRVSKNKLSQTIVYGMWLIVLLRLLIPVNIQMPTSIYNIGDGFSFYERTYDVNSVNVVDEKVVSENSTKYISENPTEQNADSYKNTKEKNSVEDQNAIEDIQVESTTTKSESNYDVNSENKTEETHNKISFNGAQIIWIIWATGVIVIGLYMFIFSRMLRKKIGELTKSDLNGISYYVSKNAEVAMLIGVFRPRIIIPKFMSEDKNILIHILNHEQVHLKRKDYLVKVLGLMALAIHWYNPLVWIMQRVMSLDMEISCDEQVLKRYNQSLRLEYAETLINVSKLVNYNFALGYVGFGEKNIKTRVKNILAYNKGKRTAIIAGVVLILAILVVFGTGRMNDEPAGDETNDLNAANSGEKKVNTVSEEESNVTSGIDSEEDDPIKGIDEVVYAFMKEYYETSDLDRERVSGLSTPPENAEDVSDDYLLEYSEIMRDIKEEYSKYIKEDTIDELISNRFLTEAAIYSIKFDTDFKLEDVELEFVKEDTTESGEVRFLYDYIVYLEKITFGVTEQIERSGKIRLFQNDDTWLIDYVSFQSFIKELMDQNLISEDKNHEPWHFNVTSKIRTHAFTFSEIVEKASKDNLPFEVPFFDEEGVTEHQTIISIGDVSISSKGLGSDSTYKIINPYDYVKSIHKALTIGEHDVFMTVKKVDVLGEDDGESYWEGESDFVETAVKEYGDEYIISDLIITRNGESDIADEVIDLSYDILEQLIDAIANKDVNYGELEFEKI